LEPLPALTEYSKHEQRICELQIGFATRLRKSQYYLVEKTKSTGACSFDSIKALRMNCEVELPRYSDKYRPTPASRLTLKKKDLHRPFFPQQIFDDYFNPKNKRRGTTHPVHGHR
jgi:DNA-directed RNA polymerase III subunit RPC7